MIAVDTSALMAILLDEDKGGRCAAVLEAETELLISAATVSEALIVAAGRRVGAEMAQMIAGLGVEVVSVTDASARRVAQVYARWGKGIHRAGLNWGDCFSYEVAQSRGCPLLYVGNDFAKTDVAHAV
ncbi:MAG: type II toxin-antitoxin system VapC family toxin [Terriglobales bacterium]